MGHSRCVVDPQDRLCLIRSARCAEPTAFTVGKRRKDSESGCEVLFGMVARVSEEPEGPLHAKRLVAEPERREGLRHSPGWPHVPCPHAEDAARNMAVGSQSRRESHESERSPVSWVSRILMSLNPRPFGVPGPHSAGPADLSRTYECPRSRSALYGRRGSPPLDGVSHRSGGCV